MQYFLVVSYCISKEKENYHLTLFDVFIHVPFDMWNEEQGDWTADLAFGGRPAIPLNHSHPQILV